VLKGMRDEAAHDASPETAEQHFKLAATYVDMGMQEEAMRALEVAARSPRHRFRAGAMLAKAYLDSGDPLHAIEWYERAVEAPAPSPVAHHALLYELASVLEAHGEGARALAEGIAARASDIDLVFVNGYGFPAFKGGPMFAADLMGLDRVLAEVEAAATAGGTGSEPAPLLRDLAARVSTFGQWDRDRR